MGLDIKYNYPHTFFLSVAVVTLIFGFYPFYINNFDFYSMHWTRILIHGILILLSLSCLLKGFSLWEDKERKREEFEEIRKKRMEQEITLNQQKLEEVDLNNKIRTLEKDKEILNKNKTVEIEKLKTELKAKEQKIVEAKAELYNLKKDEISKLPNNFSSSALTVSGASFFPVVSSGTQMLPTSVDSSYANHFLPNKKCRCCGAQLSYTQIFCPNCSTWLT